jgi:putative ABC transport system ATP-binding protein
MEILTVKNLCKTYGSGETSVEALKDVSFSVSKGEFVSIVGPSGSGKSTLLNMLGALDFPTSGKAFIDGRDIFAMKEEELAVFRRRNVGFIFQAYNLVPELNVEENIALPLLLDYKKPDHAYLSELLEILGLADRKHHLPNQLSGGQQQRVAVARAIVKNPQILLCDEPTGALDTKSSLEILRLLKAVNEKYGTTILIITHNTAIAGTTDRTVRLRDGKVVSNEVNEKIIPVDELIW